MAFHSLGLCLSKNFRSLNQYTGSYCQIELLQQTRRDNTITLSFPVGHLSKVIDDNIASFASCLGTNNSLHGNNFTDMRFLGFVCVQRNIWHVIVRISFQEILSFRCRFGEYGAKKIINEKIVSNIFIYKLNSKCVPKRIKFYDVWCHRGREPRLLGWHTQSPTCHSASSGTRLEAINWTV